VSEAALVLLGGLVALDGVAVGQFMISRPLVVGLLTGVLAGDVAAGAAVGAILEVYLLVAIPSGGARFPEPGPATVVGSAAGVWVGGAEGLALGVTAGLVWGQVGAFSQSLLRQLNGRLVPVPGDGPVTPEAVTRAHRLALMLDGTRGCLVTALGLTAVALLAPHLSPAWPLGAFSTRGLLLLGAFVSLGILARGEAPRPRRLLLFGLGLGCGILAGELLG
jgi:mannose/fructose/N-acetylgalactosamine-specific phosphotransferase system component IIC